MLQRAGSPLPLDPCLYAAEALKTLQDWNELWEAWDIVTRQMLPEGELHEKPIKLRNACIFYLGHIPAFLDIKLTGITKSPATEPAHYHRIFERGIDPDVDDPSKCHDHSQIPDEWPAVEEMLKYQDKVRRRVKELYVNGQDKIQRHIGRAIWLGFEHEAMHLETLLYMMLQSDKTLPPSYADTPNFAALAEQAFNERVANGWFNIPEQIITIGVDDPEDSLEGDGYFAW